jgi:hypothetical protein
MRLFRALGAFLRGIGRTLAGRGEVADTLDERLRRRIDHEDQAITVPGDDAVLAAERMDLTDEARAMQVDLLHMAHPELTDTAREG